MESFEDDLVADSAVSAPTPVTKQGGAANGEKTLMKDLAVKMRDAGDELVKNYGYGPRASVRNTCDLHIYF